VTPAQTTTGTDLFPSVSRGPEVPKVPEGLEDTGLSQDAVIQLILKTLHVQGAKTGHGIAQSVRLPFQLVDDLLLSLQQRQLVEVTGTQGHGRGAYNYNLLTAGRDMARDALEASRYVGPAPVPLEHFRFWIKEQSIRRYRVGREQIRDGFGDLVLAEETLEQLGPAINSARSLFIHGHPGNGKTAIAERISKLIGGAVFLPYAVDIDGETMIVYDPVYHERVQEDGGEDGQSAFVRSVPKFDQRFVMIKRPTVMVGGELTMEQLDLQYDHYSKFYQAPFQLKATGGVLIVDDFGRQRMRPAELLNRWIVPLEKEVDYLGLHTGVKFPVPFDTLLIFATNLKPHDLVDEAFLRRIHYKLRVASPTREQYEQIFKDVCTERGIPFTPYAVSHIYEAYYDKMDIWPRGCHPRDILHHVEAVWAYEGSPPTMSAEYLDRACRAYFLVIKEDELAQYSMEGTR
jgi:predicted ATPase with chaperone activity